MKNVRSFFWLLAFAPLCLSGCSVLLDPANCSSDEDCPTGICNDGICIVNELSPDGSLQTVDVGQDMYKMDAEPQEIDQFTSDAIIDMELPPLDQMILNTPPSCTISAQTELTRASDVQLLIEVTDPDSSVAGLEVSLNGNRLTLDDSGFYQGIFLITEGANNFELIAETDGQRCTAQVVVTSDQTAPKLINNQPANGTVFKSGNGRLFVAAEVVEPNFAPILDIFVDGQPTSPIGDIQWTDQAYLIELQLERGLHSVEVLVTDAIGNQTPSPSGRDCSVESCLHRFSVDVDSQPPTIVFDNLTTDGPNRILGLSVRLVGTVLDDERPLPMAFMTVNVRPENGVERTFGIQANAAGRFDQSVDVLNANSTFATVELCATDVADNEGCIELRVEKQLPCIEIEQPIDNAIVAADQLTVSGTICEGVERIEFYLNDNLSRALAVAGLTEFSANLALPENGNHTIRAVAYNDSLGESATAIKAISKDNTPPSLLFTRPIQQNQAGPLCTQSTVEVCVEVIDEDSGITAISIDDLIIPNNQLAPLVCRTIIVPQGQGVPIVARATNGSGLTASASLTLNVDDRAPFVSFTTPRLGNPWIKSDNGLVTIEGSIDSGTCATAEFKILDRGVSLQQNNQFSLILPFDEGQQNLEYQVTDLAENVRLGSHLFRVDDSKPSILVSGVESGNYFLDQEVTFSVAITDERSKVDPTSLKVDGQTYPLISSGPNDYTAQVTVTLSEGVNELTIEAADNVGNITSAVLELVRDSTPPIVSVLTPTANQAISSPAVVSGTVTDGPNGIGVATVTVNGVSANIDPESGTWYATDIEIDLTDRTIHVQSTDNLGNETSLAPITVNVPQYAPLTDLESGFVSIVKPITQVHTADLNGDDRIDILELSNGNINASRCLIQGENGRFESLDHETCGLPTFDQLQCSKMADFDGDGKLDLLYFSTTGSAILFGAGNGTFTPDNVDLITDNLITGCEVIDIDRNGQLDIIALTENNLYVLFGDQTLDFQLENPATLNLQALSNYDHLRAVDINDDGITDLIGFSDDGLTILTGLLSGTFEEVEVPTELPHSGSGGQELIIMDLDEDGKFELILMGQSTTVFKQTSADGDPITFQKEDMGLIPFANQTTGARADVDGDGRDDFLAFGAFGARVVANLGSLRTQIDHTSLGLLNMGNIQHISITDLDQDGDEDFVIASTSGLRLWKSNLMAREPNHRYFTVDIKRFPDIAGTLYRPADNHGTHLFVEYIDAETLTEDGQVLALLPNRAVIPRPNAPTIISLGQNPGAHISVRFVDKDTPGKSLRTIPRIGSNQHRTAYARE